MSHKDTNLTNWKFWLLKHTTVQTGGSVYMKRLVLTVPWLGELRLHRLFRDDWTRDPHDHPFDMTSWMLWGSYCEYRYKLVDGEVKCIRARIFKGPGWPRFLPAEQAHNLTSPDGAVTLVWAGRRRREWGFLTADGWVDWKTHLKDVT